MKTYFFEVYNSDKKRLKFVLEFETLGDFHKYLRKNRFILIKYKVKRSRYKVSQREIIEFTQNFKILLESGLTISEALNILIAQNKSSISMILRNIQNKILEGNSLYISFLPYRAIFGESYLNILLAGEESGRLTDNLERINENLLFNERIKKRIRESTFYPTVILLFTIVLIIFMLVFVFPSFIDFFKDTGVELPLLTRGLIFVSDKFYIIFSIFVILVGIIYFLLKKTEREKIENLKISLPFYGKILKKRLIIEFCKNFSIMAKSGIEIINILEILKRGSVYTFQKREIGNLQLRIKIGNSMSEGFSVTSFFDFTQLYLIEIGEKSGVLEKTFDSIAYTLEKELEFYLFKLTSLLEPILLLILGIIVGTIIMALYLPIFNITQII